MKKATLHNVLHEEGLKEKLEFSGPYLPSNAETKLAIQQADELIALFQKAEEQFGSSMNELAAGKSGFEASFSLQSKNNSAVNGGSNLVQNASTLSSLVLAKSDTPAFFRTVTDAENPDCAPLFVDFDFHRPRKKGRWQKVSAPHFACALSLVDTHVHLQMLDWPALALAQAAWHGLSFLGLVTDVVEDGFLLFDKLPLWKIQAQHLLEYYFSTHKNAGQDTYASLAANKLSGQDAHASSGANNHAGQDTHASSGANNHAGQDTHAGSSANNHAGQDTHAGSGANNSFPCLPYTRISVGCHPHYAKDFTDAHYQKMLSMLSSPLVGSVGEIGLDYHYDLSPRDVQQDVFRIQLRMAKQAQLPVCLHIREAHDDALNIVREEGFPQAGTLLHCCSLTSQELQPWVDAGCYIAYGGVFTFSNSKPARDALVLVPQDKLLTETDAPFMAPVPLRGSPCTPAMVAYTYESMMNVLGATNGVQQKQFAGIVEQNARALLDRPPTKWQIEQADAFSKML